MNWRAASAAIGAISVIGIAIGLGVPLLSIVLEKQGWSASVIGANTAVAGVAALIAAPLGPRIAHRFGLAPSMALMIAVSAMSFVGFHFLPSIAAWFALRFTLHFALTVLFILSEFWISTAAPPAKRGLILGIYATVLSVGFAAGPLIFSWTGSDGGLPFYVGAGVACLALIPLVFAWRDSVQVESGDVGGFLPYVWLVPTATAAVLVFGAVETGGFALFPVYGNRIGMPEADAALLLTAIGLGNVMLQIPLGVISDHVGDRRRVLLACALIGLCGSLALPFVIANWWLTAAILFFWGGVVAGLYTVGLAHLTTRTPPAALAQANAAFVFCYALGMLLGPQSMGAMMDAVGDNGFAWTLAAFFGAYLLLAVGRLVIRH
ncbi:MAG: MFS transporter [Rhizobiaceae bacterium]|nr:MFS transporter [Rhizobiaceae bacterium]